MNCLRNLWCRLSWFRCRSPRKWPHTLNPGLDCMMLPQRFCDASVYLEWVTRRLSRRIDFLFSTYWWCFCIWVCQRRRHTTEAHLSLLFKNMHESAIQIKKKISLATDMVMNKCIYLRGGTYSFFAPDIIEALPKIGRKFHLLY